ncbi:uncharacterized protein LOC132701176 [Cylas formicarius]|uniref:uncharacterized protein LOC132701176 n=1 Tax=Cylas formicarius TaxID=197179 RepID=UPI0029588DA5|nr:uncharacterized protein LOC132701176 [Cylas formicarius]
MEQENFYNANRTETMELTYTRRSIMFLVPILFYANIFGSVPKYDFVGKRIVTSKKRLFWLAFQIVCYGAVTVYSLHGRLEHLYDIYNSNVLVLLDLATEIVGSLTICFTIVETHLNRNLWQKFFHQLADLESCTKWCDSGRNVRETNVLRNPFVQFCFVQVFWILFSLYAILVWVYRDNHFNPSYLISRLFLNYVESLRAIVIANFALLALHKYRGINKVIVQNTRRSIRMFKIKATYLKMDDTIRTFNRLLGKQILYIFIVKSMQLVSVFSRLAQPMRVTHILSIEFHFDLILLNLLLCISSLFAVSAITFSCHATVKESEKLIGICYKLQEKFHIYSEEYQEIQNLINLVTTKRVTFTAADFFEINKPILFALVSTATSYFIVVIQLQN